MSLSRNKEKKHDSFEDFKASFVCVNEGVDGYFKTSDDLLKALQGCGRNPTQRTINSYWKEYKRIGLDEFLEIASKEQTPSEDDLIQAFKAIDTDSNGFISYKEFIDVFTTEGDALETSEIKKLMQEADLNKDELLNYKEFARLIIETTEKAKKAAREQMKKILNEREDYTNEENSFHRRLKKSTSSTLTGLDEKETSSKKNLVRNSRNFENELEDEYQSNKEKKFDNKKLFKSELSRTRSDDYLKNSVDVDNKLRKSSTGTPISPRKNKKDDSQFEIRLKPQNEIKETLKYPKNFDKWFNKSIKGGFYYNDKIDGIMANSFALDLLSDSSLFFSIETFKTPIHTNYDSANMDVSILIVKNNKKLSVKGFTEDKIENKWCTRIDLSPGRYYLFPFTTGCHLKKRVSEYTKNQAKLFEKDLNGKTTLSRQFRDALSVIFDLCDLDSNGRLSKDELNLHSFITASEDLPDEEWNFVGELVGFVKNELTKEAFIKLHNIEAKREDKDVDDIQSRLANLGFNKSLTIDQSCPFIINVSSEEDSFEILLSEIYEIKSCETFLKQILESKDVSHKIAGSDDVLIKEYHNNYWSALTVQNDSDIDVKIGIDCSKSENCISNLNKLSTDIKVKSKKTKIVMYLSHLNPKKGLIVDCSTFLKN